MTAVAAPGPAVALTPFPKIQKNKKNAYQQSYILKAKVDLCKSYGYYCDDSKNDSVYKKKIKKVHNKTFGIGQQTLTIDGSELVNGMYFCEVIINQKRFLRKMILQK